MRSVLFALAMTFLCLLHPDPEAFAQRTASGGVFLGTAADLSPSALPAPGLVIEGGRYLDRSLWKAGLRADRLFQAAAAPGSGSAPELFDHVHWTACGSWMLRVAASYGRRVCLYAGGGAFLGLHSLGVLRPLRDELRSALPGAEFVYGVEPAAELEIFPMPRTALVLGLRTPFTFLSSLPADQWRPTGSLGLRFNL